MCHVELTIIMLNRSMVKQRMWPSDACVCSGVVGRERMGTAFPHKKLSGNGVPTIEILRDIFCYCY